MTPETKADRWQTIDRLFHSTLSCAPEKRAGFLSQACGDDEALRVEVESLLRAHEQDGSFLDLPAYEVAADFLADAFGGLFAGQQIGPYKIISPLAAGGMGEVYLAQDSRLGRKIALKLLPPDFARDQHRVRRFAQEARAASALNHPNVCVIHEVGKTSDGRHFIAMELIEGITLRERILRGPLSLPDALSVGEQVAAALAVAHAAGVVHRDIKPENIMLREDGYVKVLDFGLAKLNDSHSGRNNINEDSTITQVRTEPGTRMGTVRYMSPEHLRELPVDERADIWSFGVVMHEMITGVTPFEAHARNDVVALILKRRPAKLRFLDDVPSEVQQLVAKALSKNRDQRYQTVSELAADLRRLRVELVGEISADPSPIADPNAQVRRSNAKTSLESRTRHKQKIQTHAPSDTWKSALTYISHTAEQLLSEIKGHPKATIFSGLTALVALLLIVPNVSPLMNRLRNLISPPPWQQPLLMRPLTNAGQSVCAAISPDGKSYAHVENKDGMQELDLTTIATNGNSVVVPAGNFTYRGVNFSRDGYYLYFTRSDKSDTGAVYGNPGTVYQVSVPGGTPRKIKDGVDSAISFSSNGGRFAYLRTNLARREVSLLISGVDGTGERVIATKPDAGTLFVPPAWSPDDKTIVCALGWWQKGYHTNVIAFDLETGGEEVIGPAWYSVRQLAWLEDNSGLIVCANEQPVGPVQLWQVPYPKGSTLRITNDTANYETISLARDGNTMVSIQSRQDSQLWVAPDGDAQRAREFFSTVGRVNGLDWNSKGRILFSSMSGNNLVISSIEPDGSNRIQLTANDSSNYTPTTSPDGRFIVFSSYRTGTLNIWRINADDGSEPKQLTFSDGNSYPSFSPDGEWVVYDNQSSTTFTVWKVPIEGGPTVQLTNEYTRMPAVSPDGQFIACRYLAEGSSREIAIFPFAGGAPIERLPIPVMDWQKVQWMPEGRALTYIDSAKGVSNIWRYDLNTRSARQLTDFKTDRIFAYAWSPDFKSLAWLRGTESRDVTLINKQP